jgi:hypothetical protein
MTDYNIATTNRKIVQLELIQTFQYRDGNKGFVFYFLCEIEDEDDDRNPEIAAWNRRESDGL